MAYVGLVPSEHSSGARTKRGRITRAGNAQARTMLIEAGWSYRLPAREERRYRGLYLFSHVTMIGAWCEVRGDYRAFRTERVKGCRPMDERFNGRNGTMMAEFVARFQSQ